VLARGAVLLQRRLAGRYLRAYGSHQTLSPALVEYGEVLRCVDVLVSVGEGRRARLEPDGPEPPTNPYESPLAIGRIARRLRSLTGVAPDVAALA
jgi:hypothetical protein